MRDVKRDLFDVLGISTHEDSYTTLLAAIFNEPEGEQWARDYFQAVFKRPAPVGPVKVTPRLYLRHEDMKRVDVPDLVFTFDDPVTHVWLIEAKIKSGESSDQLIRYEKEAAQVKVLTAIGAGKATNVEWHYSYLTLEGEESAKPTKFEPITYEPLSRILPPAPELGAELMPAYTCMRNRFLDYYRARHSGLTDGTSIAGMALNDYLSGTWGLVDSKNRFHWLTRQITEDLDMQPTLTEAQSASNTAFVCQMRAPGWQSDLAYGMGDVRLYECFDLHLELQLAYKGDRVTLTFHYHTNPYIPGLMNLKGIPADERTVHQQWRERFAHALAQNSGESLQQAGWKLTSPTNVNQLAKYVPDFDLKRTVGEFRQWMRKASSEMSPAVTEAAKETIW